MNQIDLTGQHAIVTGGARGIGFAIAQRLVSSGAKVSLWDLDPTALASAQECLGGATTAHTVVVNLTRPDEVTAAAAATHRHFGSLHIVVNNAGIAGVNKKTWELSPEEWHAVLDLDLNGVFYVCRATIPYLLQGGYGRVVNIASVAGKEGNPNAAHYSSAKAGVIGLTKSLGKELATSGVLVNCITPAVIETDILKQMTAQHIDYMRSKIPMNRFGQTTEAAALVAWLCSKDCSFSTGAVFDLSGGRATY
jgi:NAD(P)-dependent dehydrogenase (short-subunit alcohol dehydrogenase family)